MWSTCSCGALRSDRRRDYAECPRVESRLNRSVLTVAAVVLVLARSTNAQEPAPLVTLDVDAAVAMALDSNYQIRQSVSAEAIAQSQIKEVTAAVWPQLSISGAYSRNVKKPVFYFDLGGEVQPVTIGSFPAQTGLILDIK